MSDISNLMPSYWEVQNAAVLLSSGGVPVFPCGMDKAPAIKTGFHAASTEADKVTAWFSASGKMIGVPMGEITCLDIDAKHRANLIEDFEAAIATAGLTDLLESMPKQLTVNGGCHYFFRVPELSDQIGNTKISKNADKETIIETRGNGGYVITAPSKGYRFTRGDLNEAPSITLEMWESVISVCKQFNEVPEVERTEISHKPRGLITGDSPGDQYNARGDMFALLQGAGWTPSRDASRWTRPGKTSGVSATWDSPKTPNKFYVFSTSADPFNSEESYSPFAVYTLLEHGGLTEGHFSEATKALAALGYGEKIDQEPLAPEVIASINSMVAKAMAKGVRITQVIEAEKKTEAPTASSKPVPQSVYDNAPAIIREFQEWAEGEAIVPQPFLSLAAGLALMSVTCGRKYSFRGQRSNLFIVVSAPSSAGKENGRKALKAALSRPCAIDMLGSGSVASDTAILRTLEEKKRVLFPFDEVGHMIANNKAAKGAAHLANIAPTLMELYSSAGGIWPGRSYADKDNNIAPIEDPHLCIYGTTTPIMVKQAFTSEDAQTGFTGRVLFFQSFDEPVPRIKPNGAKFPNGVRDYIEFMCASDPKALSGDLAFLNQSKELPCAKELPCDSDASDLLREFQLKLHTQKVKNQCDSIKGIIGKAYEICMRVAICAAVAENYRNPRITTKAAQWAIDLVQYLTDECLVMAEKNMHNTELDEECDKILCKIRSIKGGVSRREIMQTVKGIGERGSAADYGRVLAELEIRELINTEKLGKKEIYTAA